MPLHERIGRFDRAVQNHLRGRVVEMVEGKVEHSALFALGPTDSHPFRCIHRLRNVGDVFAPARDFLPRLDIRPQIREHESHLVQPGRRQFCVHVLLDERGGPAGARASVNIGVLCRLFGTAQLIDHDFAGLHGGRAAVGDGHAPGADESFVGVLA